MGEGLIVQIPPLQWGWLGKCTLTQGNLVKLPSYGVGLGKGDLVKVPSHRGGWGN